MVLSSWKLNTAGLECRSEKPENERDLGQCVRVKIGAHECVAPSEIIVLKSYMLYDSIYGFWKRQKYRNGEHISG